MNNRISDIIENYLDANGYDGLTDDSECGCSSNDLAPCRCCLCDCFPAYKHPDGLFRRVKPRSVCGEPPTDHKEEWPCPKCGDESYSCHCDEDSETNVGEA